MPQSPKPIIWIFVKIWVGGKKHLCKAVIRKFKRKTIKWITNKSIFQVKRKNCKVKMNLDLGINKFLFVHLLESDQMWFNFMHGQHHQVFKKKTQNMCVVHIIFPSPDNILFAFLKPQSSFPKDFGLYCFLSSIWCVWLLVFFMLFHSMCLPSTFHLEKEIKVNMIMLHSIYLWVIAHTICVSVWSS